MSAVQVPQVADMTGDVFIEIDIGERRLAPVVIGAEGERQRAAAPRLVLECGDERPAYPAKPVLPPYDERVQFPHPAVVFRDATDPAEEEGVPEGGDSETAAKDMSHFPGCGLQVRPSPRVIVKALHQQHRGLPANGVGQSAKIGRPHITAP